jgi:hypothetical protein
MSRRFANKEKMSIALSLEHGRGGVDGVWLLF